MIRQILLQNGQKITISEFNIESKSGQKPTLLFVHGNSSNRHWWDDVVTDKKFNAYHIISVDQRGFGDSSYTNKCSRYKDWAEDLIDLVKILKISSVVAIGWSFGGGVSMKLAQLAPELVKCLIGTCSVSHLNFPLINNAQNYVQCKSEQSIRTHPKISFMIDLINTKNKQMMRTVFDTVIFTKMPNYPEKKKKQLSQSIFMQRCYLDTMIALTNSDINVQKIKCKALFIHGTEDKVVDFGLTENTGKTLGKFQAWENHAHMIPLEDTQRYINRIIQFISQN